MLLPIQLSRPGGSALLNLKLRRLCLWTGLVVVVGAAGSTLVAVLTPVGLAGDLVQAVTSVLALAGALILWLWRSSRRSRIHVTEPARVCDALADAVLAQWERAAGERRLRYPSPISVRWQWSSRAVTGPTEEIFGGTCGVVRFAPLPGLTTTDPSMVDAGTLGDLFRVFGGLESGRVIVLGGAGTGKSSAAILGVIDAMRHRRGIDAALRTQMPVFVLLTAHGWDPRRHGINEWVAARLEQDYPFLRRDEYGRDVAKGLVDTGRVALVLDGFDEIPEDLRQLAIHAIDQQAMCRLMILTRTQELVDAVVGGHLHAAAALELVPVSPQDAANYLLRCQLQPAAPAWCTLADLIPAAPTSAVSTALDNPLMLTLVRDTFPVVAELDDFIRTGRFCSRADVEEYLLNRVLPAAYRGRPGCLDNTYSFTQAHRWLTFLATEMKKRDTRNLAWWHIGQWAPTRIRVIARALPSTIGVGAMAGPMLGLLYGLTYGLLAGALVGLANGIAIGMAVGARGDGAARLSSRPAFAIWMRISTRPWLISGLVSALAAGMAFGTGSAVSHGGQAGMTIGLAAAAGFGLAVGTTERLLELRRKAGPRQFAPSGWHVVATRRNLLVGLAFGLAFGSNVGMTFGLTRGGDAGIVAGLFIGLAGAALLGTVNGLMRDSTATVSPMDPVTSWRHDRRAAIAEGMAYGIASGIAFGIVGTVTSGLGTGLALAVINTIAVGIAYAIAVSQAGLAMVTFYLLGLAGLFPARGFRFLEDARRRGVMRTVGAAYQFRHARLQDQLAGTGLVAPNPGARPDMERRPVHHDSRLPAV